MQGTCSRLSHPSTLIAPFLLFSVLCIATVLTGIWVDGLFAQDGQVGGGAAVAFFLAAAGAIRARCPNTLQNVCACSANRPVCAAEGRCFQFCCWELADNGSGVASQAPGYAANRGPVTARLGGTSAGVSNVGKAACGGGERALGHMAVCGGCTAHALCWGCAGVQHSPPPHTPCMESHWRFHAGACSTLPSEPLSHACRPMRAPPTAPPLPYC